MRPDPDPSGNPPVWDFMTIRHAVSETARRNKKENDS